ncbi:probable RNA-directed DNA polymerase from transposon X-element [Trichonephila clavipes]|nr:probable RNA-directed DNA polymerase from transposon X-element [Trichonephila clavipes]
MLTSSDSSRWCSCLDGAVRLARTIDLEGYTGGSLLLVGSPKPGRPKATRIKLDQLLEIALKQDVKVISVQETKLKESTALKVKGFNIFRVDRKSKSGGGLAFFVRDINYQKIEYPTDWSDLEVQGIRIQWRGKPLDIINVYHPPNHKPLPPALSNLLNKNSIIVGYLNAKHPSWGCSCSNARGEELLQLLDDTESMILNDGTHTFTSYSYNTSAALDIAITSSELFPQCSWRVLDTIGSDHFPVLICFKRRQKVQIKQNNFWNFKKANWDSYMDSVDQNLTSTPFTNDLEENWTNFKNIILDNAKLYIPRGNVKGYIPLFTHNASSLKPLLDRRKQLLESFNENNSLNDSQGGLRTEINQINAKIRKSYAQLKRSRWRELCKNLDSRTTNSKLWRIVKKINKEQEQCEESNSVIDTNGQVFPDDKAAANGLAVYYQETSKLVFTSEDKSVMKRAKNIIHGCRTSDVGDQGLPRDFSQQELLLAMAFLDMTKSPGPDGVFGRMLENLGHRGKLRLLDIINLSWKIGRLPAEWKRAIIIPIKKAGKNNWSPKDLRPIALTSTTCKIMEKMILIRIQYFLDSKNLIPGEQYGYRRGHSTVDQIISFCQSIRDAQNCKPTHHTMAALLDLTKAFDRVWKHKLLIKLHDTFNIRGNTLAWISDFLHHRSMRVNFNNTFSDPVVLGQGVPQGSVLSPTLFSLYLAGIEKIPSVEMRVGLFADDIVVWCSGRDLVEMERNLNNALSSFSDYALEFKLCFNPTKSIATFFTTNKRLKRLSILKFIAGKDWGADAVTLRDTFLALIRPILEYGFPVYCCASAASLEKLEKIQLGAARIITGLRRSCPKEIVLFEADLQPLHLRSKNILTNYFNKLSSYGHHNKTSLYFNNWHNNQRLKRNSPFSYADHLQFPSSHIEPHSLKSCLSPSEGLPRVHFHFNMSAPVTKQDLIPAHLRQLALESINEIPCDAIKIYTDGSRLDDRAGSGIYIENSGQNFYFCHRNPDFSSVFKSELTAIKLGLEAIINESDYGELWILSDSRSSLQHLHNWTQVGDKTSISILHNLKLISKHHDVHFQWIPSHVDIFGNEQADRLAREDCSLLTTSSPAITYSEHQSKINRQLSKEWKIPPSHHWYAAREQGSFLDLNCDRASKTAISRLASGHMKSLSPSLRAGRLLSSAQVQGSAGLCRTYPGLSGSFQRRLVRFSPSCYRSFLRVNNWCLRCPVRSCLTKGQQLEGQ